MRIRNVFSTKNCSENKKPVFRQRTADHQFHAVRTITLDNIEVEVTYKRVKNVNLRVYPAEKRVAVSCPPLLPDAALQTYLRNKIGWIKKNLNKPVRPDKKQKRGLKNGDQLLLWGEKYPLMIGEKESGKTDVLFRGNHIFFRLKGNPPDEKKQTMLAEWYRHQIKQEIPGFIAKWQPVMGVEVKDFGVKRMKTRWGTCNIRARRIWLNLLLVEKPKECLELVVVHEMAHLLERLHTPRFYSLMDQFLPDWRERENLLKV